MATPTGFGDFIGGPLAGLLNFSQSIRDRRALNPLAMQQSQEQAFASQDVARGALGQSGNEGLLGQGGGSSDLNQLGGAMSDLGPARGLLANPRFAERRAELTFATELMSDPTTNAMGQQMLTSLVNQQAGIDTQRQTRRDTLNSELVNAARDEAIRKTEVALDIQDDFRRDVSDIASQIPEIQGFYNTLANGSSEATLAAAFQFFNLVEPGGITREDERSAFAASSGKYNEVVNLMNKIRGEGMTISTRRELARVATGFVQPRFDRLEQLTAEFQQTGRLAGLTGDDLEIVTLGQAVGLIPQIPNILIPPAPPPAEDLPDGSTGSTPGRVSGRFNPNNKQRKQILPRGGAT